MIDQISFCRGCVSTELSDVLKLQSIPIGDSFSVNTNCEQTYPIGLSLCAYCGLVQLSHRVDRSIVFERYFSQSFPVIEDDKEQPALISGSKTFFSGLISFAVSAIK